MAVTCLLRRAGDAWISQLQRAVDLAEAERLAFAAEGTPQTAPPEPPTSLWARIFRRRSGTGAAACAPPDDVLDLYKSWHGLHFLLTGCDNGGEWPMSFLYGGATPIGDESSPVSVLSSPQVREVAQVLSPLGPSELRPRFDPAEMEGQCVYPGGWEFDSEEQTFQWLAEQFEQLKRFVAETAEQGRGLVIRIG
jgi:hypothetical protein